MAQSFEQLIQGYHRFREKYAAGDHSPMEILATDGQHPEVMVVSCCDSRVDPAQIFQCDPGDIFTVRNIANLVAPMDASEKNPSTSAALEFAVCALEVKHLIIMGHSQCGGMKAFLDPTVLKQNDFVSNWVSQVAIDTSDIQTPEQAAQASLNASYENCLTYPWIQSRVDEGLLTLHRWYFDIETGQILMPQEGSSLEFAPLG